MKFPVVNNINSPNFGQVIFDDAYVQEVAANDFKDHKLWKSYQNIIEKQKSNPVDIHLDLFLHDPGEIPLYPEGWYIKAQVKNKTFKQRVYYGSPLTFLKRASIYADACNLFNKILKR